VPKPDDGNSFVLRKRLKTELDFRAMTAADLARRTGVPKQVISDWLAGVTPRRLDHLKKVAAELCTTIDELCFGTDSQPPLTQTLRIEGLPPGDNLVGRYEILVQKIS